MELVEPKVWAKDVLKGTNAFLMHVKPVENVAPTPPSLNRTTHLLILSYPRYLPSMLILQMCSQKPALTSFLSTEITTTPLTLLMKQSSHLTDPFTIFLRRSWPCYKHILICTSKPDLLDLLSHRQKLLFCLQKNSTAVFDYMLIIEV